MNYPLCLYRDGDQFDWDGRPTDQCEARDEADHQRLAAEGWAESADYLASPAPAKKATAFSGTGTLATANKPDPRLATLEADLKAANELIEEERVARATAEFERDQATGQLADLQTQMADTSVMDALVAENADLKAKIAPFDRDGVNGPGGSKPKLGIKTKAGG